MKSFTLIETLVAIVILTLAFGAVFGFIVMLYRTQSFSLNQAMAVDEAQRGVKTMIREIREARPGDDGSYSIEKADDKEFIFYSDIDKDDEVERVRYFLGTVSSGSQTQQCVAFSDGGSCSVLFPDFLQGDLISAQVVVSVEGDLGMNQEYVEVYADSQYLGRICQTGCSDCIGVWQGVTTFDVTNLAFDGSVEFIADATSSVDNVCDWEEPNHSVKARFRLLWEEEISGQEHQLKKGIINPTAEPVEYPQDQEEISIISSYVRNNPPIFSYFDAQGNEIMEYPARLIDAKLMKIYLVVNINPARPPDDFELESYVQLRNLK